MENNSSSRIHTLVAGAAISVILVSLTGIAAITGLIPTSHSGNTAADAEMDQAVASTVGAAHAASSPAALLADSETGKSSVPPKSSIAQERPTASAQRRVQIAEVPSSQRHTDTAENPTARAPVCGQCGHVESVVSKQQAAKPSGVGIAAGAIIGGVLGNQIGGGSGRTLATVAGAVGGGYAGNEVEKRTRTTTTYEVRVRMEDGEVRTFPSEEQPTWSVGDRVKVVNGALVARS